MTKKAEAQVKSVVMIEDGAALDKYISSISRAGKKLDEQIHIAAMSAIWHFGVRKNAQGELIGDVGYINRLYLALGKGARHAALTEWFTRFGGVSANHDKKNNKQNPFVKDKGKVVDIEGAKAMPWYECKPSKAPDEVLDYYALILRAVNKQPKDGQSVKGADFAAKISKLLAEELPDEAQAVAADDAALSAVGEALL